MKKDNNSSIEFECLALAGVEFPSFCTHIFFIFRFGLILFGFACVHCAFHSSVLRLLLLLLLQLARVKTLSHIDTVSVLILRARARLHPFRLRLRVVSSCASCLRLSFVCQARRGQRVRAAAIAHRNLLEPSLSRSRLESIINQIINSSFSLASAALRLRTLAWTGTGRPASQPAYSSEHWPGRPG